MIFIESFTLVFVSPPYGEYILHPYYFINAISELNVIKLNVRLMLTQDWLFRVITINTIAIVKQT